MNLQKAVNLADQVTEKILEIEDVESVGAMAGGTSMLSIGKQQRQSGDLISDF